MNKKDDTEKALNDLKSIIDNYEKLKEEKKELEEIVKSNKSIFYCGDIVKVNIALYDDNYGLDFDLYKPDIVPFKVCYASEKEICLISQEYSYIDDDGRDKSKFYLEEAISLKWIYSFVYKRKKFVGLCTIPSYKQITEKCCQRTFFYEEKYFGSFWTNSKCNDIFNNDERNYWCIDVGGKAYKCNINAIQSNCHQVIPFISIVNYN